MERGAAQDYPLEPSDAEREDESLFDQAPALDCRCLGKDRNCECDNQADAEDGLCQNCRYPDGGCCEGRSWTELEAQTARLLIHLAGGGPTE